jgi:HlyD family secretion protein
LQKQQQQVQDRLATITRLQEEEKRLRYSTAKAGQDFINTLAITEKDVRDRIGANDQRIAEIDTLLTKTIVQNENQIADLDSQISAAQVTLKYQALKAPVSGTVFDLKATPGYVPQSAQAAQSDPLLKIIPDDYLVAEVNITNQDIGFVRKGMKTDVRIDSFPYSEFGDIKGKVSWIGSDALKPNEIEKYYRFPAKIALDSQTLKVGDRQIPLQSGMSVSANIKVRENRTVMSLFWESFTGKFESLEKVR